MSEQVVSGRTRGQYGRGLDLSKIVEVQGHTFVSPKTEHLVIKLKDEKKHVINGEVVTTPLVKAEFVQHRFVTKDEEVAELIRRSDAFRLGKVKELAVAKQDDKEAKLRKLQAEIEADPELLEAVKSLTRSKTAATPEFEKKSRASVKD